MTAMIQDISELPLPNRDTLAYLIIHLQTVAENYTVNKMGKDNLSMILAPTVVGNSSSDPMAILQEKDSQMAVMSNLMSISLKESFLIYEYEQKLCWYVGNILVC